MKKVLWQFLVAAVCAVAITGDSKPVLAGDYDRLPSEGQDLSQSLHEFMDELRAESEALGPDPEPQRRAEGVLRQVQLVAEVMLEPGAAEAWGWSGRLTTEDLTNDFFVRREQRIEGFNVFDAEGFVERFKCNLFVFELAYRAGLRVPLMGRQMGWGYIGPIEVLRQIEEENFNRDWAVLVDDLEIDELRQGTALGVPFMLVAEGQDGRAGHMGMVDEFHVVERNEEGAIHRIVYTGWEANGDAAHYRRRIWGLWRFETIHVLELQEPESGEAQCHPLDRGPTHPSYLDARRFARASHDVPNSPSTKARGLVGRAPRSGGSAQGVTIADLAMKRPRLASNVRSAPRRQSTPSASQRPGLDWRSPLIEPLAGLFRIFGLGDALRSIVLRHMLPALRAPHHDPGVIRWTTEPITSHDLLSLAPTRETSQRELSHLLPRAESKLQSASRKPEASPPPQDQTR